MASKGEVLKFTMSQKLDLAVPGWRARQTAATPATDRIERMDQKQRDEPSLCMLRLSEICQLTGDEGSCQSGGPRRKSDGGQAHGVLLQKAETWRPGVSTSISLDRLASWRATL